MSEIAIEVANLTKKFKIYENVFIDRLKAFFCFWNRSKYYNRFSALEDVNFTLKRGEVVGLIGPNGAGKTTMLKILAGISPPTSGRVTVKGNLVAVLALGLGFNPRFTGRENIVIGGCLLGMSREEIREKEDWIIEFSELKEFIDQPIRTYSTGMQARLSFSVAAAVSPDILIIDEALATGDAFFVQKSLGRIHEICKSGTTAIFVSHNLMQIQRLCSERVILLEQGKIINDGPAKDVIKHYNEVFFKAQEKEAQKQTTRARALVNTATIEPTEEPEGDSLGTDTLKVTNISMHDLKGEEKVAFRSGEPVKLKFRYLAAKPIEEARISVVIHNNAGQLCSGVMTNNYLDADSGSFTDRDVAIPQGYGSIDFTFVPLLLGTGSYLVSLTIYNAKVLMGEKGTVRDSVLFMELYMHEFTVLKNMVNASSFIYENPVRVAVTADLP